MGVCSAAAIETRGALPMPPLLKLHAWKLAGLLLLANLGLLTHLVAGSIKPDGEWNWTDILGEGGSALLVLLWMCFLKSRPQMDLTLIIIQNYFNVLM